MDEGWAEFIAGVVGGDKAGMAPQRVTPAKAGVQFLFCAFGALDSGFRRNDGEWIAVDVDVDVDKDWLVAGTSRAMTET